MCVFGKLDLQALIAPRLEASVAFPFLPVGRVDEDGILRNLDGDTRLILLFKASIAPPLISAGCQIGLGGEFELEACLLCRAITSFAFPAGSCGGIGQECFLRDFNKVATHIGLTVSTQASPAVAGRWVEICIGRDLDGKALVPLLEKAVVAIPSIAKGGVRQKRVVGKLHLEAGVILPSKTTIACPAGAVAACLGIFRHRPCGLAERRGAESRCKLQGRTVIVRASAL